MRVARRRGSRHGISRAEYRIRAHEFCRRGIALPHARLDEATVRTLRANAAGLTARQWAERLGVHVRTIESVRTYRTWRHVA
jgi:hypothetical protein